MKEKYIFDDFKSYKSSYDKYYDLGSYMFDDLLRYKADKSEKTRRNSRRKRSSFIKRESCCKRS